MVSAFCSPPLPPPPPPHTTTTTTTTHTRAHKHRAFVISSGFCANVYTYLCIYLYIHVYLTLKHRAFDLSSGFCADMCDYGVQAYDTAVTEDGIVSFFFFSFSVRLWSEGDKTAVNQDGIVSFSF
jgi:hypothetical protein